MSVEERGKQAALKSGAGSWSPAIAVWYDRPELVRIEPILALLEAPHMTTSPDTLIYCFKCRVKTESNDLEQVVLKNRRDATRAVCAVCGTKKFRIGKLG